MSSLPEQKLKALKKLYAILVELGYDFSHFDKNLQSRVIFQKLVYSLQKTGFNFGYNYNLYIKGPYSPDLASDGYLIVENLQHLSMDTAPFKLSDHGMSKVEATKEFLSAEVSNPAWLETIVTLDYLFKYNPIKTQEAVFEAFRRIKPHLNDRAALEKAWTKIKSA